MKAIVCELCGSNDLMKKDGFFQCECCGTKYSLEEARKLLVNGIVSIEGDVKTKDADFIVRAGTLEAYNGESPVVTIPDNVLHFKKECFKGMSIEKVILPSSMTEISPEAFANCRTLKEVIIPDSVTSIGSGAFSGCKSLKSITIPNSVKSIGNNAFFGCAALKSITIPDSITSIGSWAFQNCTALVSITLPDSVTRIESWAFQDCTALCSAVLPEKLEHMGDNLFLGCTALDPVQTKVPVPHSEKGNLFSECGFEEKGYCTNCGGMLKKGLLSSKCTRCGREA